MAGNVEFTEVPDGNAANEQPTPAGAPERFNLSYIADLRQKWQVVASPQIPGEQHDLETKRQVVDAYLEKREAEVVAEHGGYLSKRRAKVAEQKTFQANRTLRPLQQLKGRAEHFLNLRKFKGAGVKDSEQVLKILETDDGSSSEFLRYDRTIQNLLELPDPLKAFSRLETLGIVSSGLVYGDIEMARAVRDIAEVPDEDFQRIATELDRMFFFTTYNVSGMTGGHSGEEYGKPDVGLSLIAEVCRSNGFSPELKAKIDSARKFALITDRLPSVSESGRVVKGESNFVSQYGPDPTYFNHDNPATPRCLEVLEILEDRVYQQLQQGVDRPFINGDILPEVDQLIEISNGILLRLTDAEKALIWDDEYGLNSYFNRTLWSERLRTLADSGADPQRREWLELLADSGIDEARLSLENARHLENLWLQRHSVEGLVELGRMLEVPFHQVLSFSPGVLTRSDIEPNSELTHALNTFDDQSHPAYKFLKFLKFYTSIYSDLRGNSELLGFFGREREKYLAVAKDDQGGVPAVLVEQMSREEIALPDYIFHDCRDVEHFSASFALTHFPKFSSESQIKIIQGLEESNFSQVDINERPMVRFVWEGLKMSPIFPADFLLLNRGEFDRYVVDGRLTPEFVYDWAKSGFFKGDRLQTVLASPISGLGQVDQEFWQTWLNLPADIRGFILRQPYGHFMGVDGRVELRRIEQEFLANVRVHPNEVTTYESMAPFFQQISHFPQHEERSRIYLQLAEGHKHRTISTRTEVEAIVRLKNCFADLYYPRMSTQERLAWKILQRHLPFTSNERLRGEMRDQALVVENLDGPRLSWVHQSVHNYASVFEVDYLRSLKRFLTSGDSSELQSLATRFGQDSSAPSYSETNRQELITNPQLIPQLDKLIELASDFYEIKPESMEQVGEISRQLLSAAIPEVTTLTSDLMSAGSGQIKSPAELRSAIHFCLATPAVRLQIQARLARLNQYSDDTLLGQNARVVSEKSTLMVADAILDDLMQKMLTKYHDYIFDNQDTLSQDDWLQAATVYSSGAKAALINGELALSAPDKVPNIPFLKDVRQSIEAIDNLRIAADPVSLQRGLSALALFPHLFQEPHWQTFRAQATPALVEMLIASGLTEEQAAEQAVFTDLVEMHKASTTYVLEPFYQLLKAHLLVGSVPITPSGIYQRVTGESSQLPKNLSEASTTLNRLASGSEHRAYKLARMVVPGFTTTNGEKMEIEHNGHKIEFSTDAPFGVDRVKIIYDGQEVEDPERFLKQNFAVLPVQINLLREGD